MLILKIQIALMMFPQILGWNVSPDIRVEEHLLPRHRIDERRYQFEEGVDVPGEFAYEGSTEAFRVVVLEDVEDGSGLTDCRYFARRGAFEVYDEAGVFLACGHHVYRSIEHEAQVVDLAIGHFGVLFGGV